MGTTQGRRWPSVGSTLSAEQRAPGEHDGQGSAAPFVRRPAAPWTVAPPTLLVLLGYVCFKSGQHSRHRERQERPCSEQAAQGWPLWAGEASEPVSEASRSDRTSEPLTPVVLVHPFAAPRSPMTVGLHIGRRATPCACRRLETGGVSSACRRARRPVCLRESAGPRRLCPSGGCPTGRTRSWRRPCPTAGPPDGPSPV
jgi:hypothetical protein